MKEKRTQDPQLSVDSAKLNRVSNFSRLDKVAQVLSGEDGHD